MTEQLYKLEHRDRLEISSGIDIWDKYGLCYTLHPVPATHTLAWALGEMVANPMREYGHGGEDAHRVRFNRANQRFEWWDGDQMLWLPLSWFTTSEVESTSWFLCEAEPTQPQAAPTLEQTSEVTDFWWALRQMYDNPMKEFEASPGPDHGAPWIRFRYNRMNGKLEHRYSNGEWPAASVTCGMLSWTNWREHVEPVPVPVLTLEQRVERLEKLMEAKR